MLIFIGDYVNKKLEEGGAGSAVAKLLGVSTSMVSEYKNNRYNSSLEVAKRVYTIDKVVLHPFDERSLQYELR